MRMDSLNEKMKRQNDEELRRLKERWLQVNEKGKNRYGKEIKARKDKGRERDTKIN